MPEPANPSDKVINTVIGVPLAQNGPDDRTASWQPQIPDSDGNDIRPLLAPAETPDELGRLGHFRILKKLGAGGMGMVLLAEDINLQRPVALKIMLPKYASNLDAKERFLREARAAAKIHHDHVVTIYHVGDDRGIPHIAMECLQGAPLDSYLKEKKNVSISQALRIVRETAEGLQAAHVKGLIHRDIKPGNIWLEAPKGRVKILDFGLARDTADEMKITHSGSVLGTPAYMSPEQASGNKADLRSDLFSLGIVLYELVSGRLPFKAPSMIPMMHALMYEPHDSLASVTPDVPAGLVKLIDRLLAKKPQDRPASAAEVAHALAELETQIPFCRDSESSENRAAPPNQTTAPTKPFSRDSESSENRAQFTSKTQITERTREKSPLPKTAKRTRWLIPTGIIATVGAVFLAIVLLPGKKPKPTEEETSSEVPTNVAINPRTETLNKGDATNEDPKEIIKINSPNVKDNETTYDLGNGVKLEMIKINAKGKSFMMGSPRGEALRSDDEEQHEVTFNHDFSMAKYKVTQEQYEAIMGANPSLFFKGPKRPVETVKWIEAQQFCTNLNEKFKDRKVTFRLPSEAEWEYSCRAGTTTRFNTGLTLTKEQANFGGKSDVGTKPVDSFKPNKFGLHDMHGNLHEWCEDYYGDYKAAPKDGTAQKAKQAKDVRVLRSGHWGLGSEFCRSASRHNCAPDADYNVYHGFRVVVTQNEAIEPK